MDNLATLCGIQAHLDKTILEGKPNNLTSDERFINTLTALDVELSEFANEGRWFKVWSENQEPRDEELVMLPFGKWVEDEWVEIRPAAYKNPLLEEYVDAVHFFLSLANQQEWQDVLRFEVRLLSDMYDGTDRVQRFNENYLEMKYQLATVFKRKNKLAFGTAWMNFLILGMSGFEFTWEQISEAYLAKNKINYQRQESGY